MWSNLKAAFIVLAAIFFLTGICYSYTLSEPQNFLLTLDYYLRQDVVSFKNVVDLDSSNSDDTTTYLGIDYSLGFKTEFKNNGPIFYLKLERNGPSDYSAPLFAHNTLMTSGGVIEEYRNDELLPQIEEFWLDTALFNPFRAKAGLYTYEVGNGFSLNGSYENFGFTFYRQSQDFIWRLHYHRPDLVYKNHLGPRIRQDEEQGYDYNHNAANFFSTDIKLNTPNGYLWPYIGALVDYTAPLKRTNVFSAPIKKDILGTLGIAWDFTVKNLSLKTEIARNFGKGESESPDYKDIVHRGYLVYTRTDYKLGRFRPSFAFLASSGNKVTPDMAQDETLNTSKNRAFSYTSPLNKNLDDSISCSNAEARPIVAMGSCYGLNYGILRPRTFSASDFDNIIMPSLSFDFEVTDKFSFGVYGYYLRSFEKGAGILDGEAKYLSPDLGKEIDIFVDYKINGHTLFSFEAGYFFPGKHYKERREDTTNGSLLSPFVRGDGDVDGAYQVEFALEFNF